MNRGETILNQTAAKYGMSPRELTDHSRFAYIVKIRHEAIYRIKAETRYSGPQIAKIMHRDPTTILWALKSYAARTGLPRLEGLGKND